MFHKIEKDKLCVSDNLRGEDDADTNLLIQMSKEAKDYIKSFDWCPPVVEEYFGFGVGGLVAVFLFVFRDEVRGTKIDTIWVVVGDLPSAYLVPDNAPNAETALEIYCELMENWAKSVLAGRPLTDVFPVSAKPTPKHARMLLSRIEFIRKEILRERKP